MPTFVFGMLICQRIPTPFEGAHTASEVPKLGHLELRAWIKLGIDIAGCAHALGSARIDYGT